MATGPGKYDDVATLVREQVGLKDGMQGGVVVIVIGGDKGNGFSVQADLTTTVRLPQILEALVAQIRKDSTSLGET